MEPKTADDYVDDIRAECPNGCQTVDRKLACKRCWDNAALVAKTINRSLEAMSGAKQVRRILEKRD